MTKIEIIVQEIKDTIHNSGQVDEIVVNGLDQEQLDEVLRDFIY